MTLPRFAVNQVEMHPLLPQRAVVEFCHAHDIAVTAYTSLGEGSDDLLRSPVVMRIASSHERTAAQVLLRWALQRGVAVIPKSVTASRIDENARLFDFELSADDMAAMAALETGKKYCWNPDTVL
jgi:diketogulonate reductase-like aldo/keto reductase